MFKEQTINDCLFGKLTKKGDFYRISLYTLTELSGQLKPAHFSDQVGRLLRSVNGKLDAIDETSAPPLSELLDMIPEEKIQLIRIGRRNDVNESVKYTLDCSIFLADGLLRVTAHWCAYKDIRAGEIVSTLLTPLMENKLLDRTFIDYGDSEFEKIPTDFNDAKFSLLAFSGYPEVIKY